MSVLLRSPPNNSPPQNFALGINRYDFNTLNDQLYALKKYTITYQRMINIHMKMVDFYKKFQLINPSILEFDNKNTLIEPRSKMYIMSVKPNPLEFYIFITQNAQQDYVFLLPQYRYAITSTDPNNFIHQINDYLMKNFRPGQMKYRG